jgi:deoxyribonuclease V
MVLENFVMPKSREHACALQRSLSEQLIIRDEFQTLEIVAGIDVGYDNYRALAHASIVTMRLDDLAACEQVQAFVPVGIPYGPGLMAFREIRAILQALAKLDIQPDLLMVDGHGIAHPRRMGIAAHLGVMLDKPAIGAAKSRLFGECFEPGILKGDHAPLMSGPEQIGVVLRT